MPRNRLCPSMLIPDELIVEFLKRLPAKSLIRCMLVCKSWRLLIKNPNFISTHFNHHSNQVPRYLMYSFLKDFYVFKDDDRFDMQLVLTCPNPSYSVGCCNGIVCFGDFEDDTSFKLWNSSLNRYLDVEVPHCSVSEYEKNTSWFGFDAVSNDYKLVWVAYSVSESWETRPLCVYVYSLNERAWRCLESSFVEEDVTLIQRDAVYLNGVVHWVVQTYYEERDMPEFILTFNLVDETFGALDLPSEIAYVEPDENQDLCLWPEDGVDVTVVKRGNKSCLAVLHEDLTNLTFWVMEMEGVVGSWRKEFSVRRIGFIKEILNVRLSGEIVIRMDNGDVVSWDYLRYKTKLIAREEVCYRGTYMENLLLL